MMARALKLAAEDAEDLQVLSARLQDAAAKLKDVATGDLLLDHDQPVELPELIVVAFKLEDPKKQTPGCSEYPFNGKERHPLIAGGEVRNTVIKVELHPRADHQRGEDRDQEQQNM